MKIILLCIDDEFSKFLFNRVNPKYPVSDIIIENKVATKKIIQRRIKKLGLVKVLGQIIFKLVIVPFLKIKSKKRVSEIKQLLQLDGASFDKNKIAMVDSVNSQKARELLKKLNPDLVLVNGTRIISKKTINCINSLFINIHVGITPKYRGIHGGYWAVKENDLDLFGVTLHYIDEGIDTGQVIDQKVINNVSPNKDNFCTYPYLQYGEGISLLMKNIDTILEGKKLSKDPLTKESKIWSSPSIW